ncbi:MAG: GGDEF domain-containing protein [Halioglobus sp.]
MDPLTQVFNRRYFEQVAESEHSRARRNGAPLSLILLDIDHFKSFNDDHGHLVGDQVLTAVAKRTQDEVRKSDVLARFGGEEFVLLMPDTDLEPTKHKAEEIRLGIGELQITVEGETVVSVNVSLDVANWTSEQSLNEALDQADKALYRAKESGRNRTEV